MKTQNPTVIQPIPAFLRFMRQTCLIGVTLFVFAPPILGQEANCPIDLTNPNQMSDIVSNALTLGLNQNETAVRSFLDSADGQFKTGQELLLASATKFQVAEDELSTQVAKYKHCNCKHGLVSDTNKPIAATNDQDPPNVGSSSNERAQYDRSANAKTADLDSDGIEQGPIVGDDAVTQFATDVTLHVVLHEMGHALIREFDLPVLANEETQADAFATHYLTTYLPDRAFDVIRARTKSLMIEADEVPRQEWTIRGEHNSDARRAFQIAALAVAADPVRYTPIAKEIGMTEDDIRSCRDYGTEIHRSWRRVLRPLWMPDKKVSTEMRVGFDGESKFVNDFCSKGLAKEVEFALGRFDWHSQVSVFFAESDGGAGWNRSRRTITVNSEYVKRFFKQGTIANR